MTHPAVISTEELLRDCDVSFLRRSGPGGQHRNKVETAVRIRHRPTGIQAEASQRRSQAENRAAALKRLRLKLALSVRCGHGQAGVPSALWNARCANRRVVVNARHEDFPALLAEALDVLEACDFDVSAAAAQLRVSSSQLVKLLKKEPPALGLVNAHREAQHLPPLR